MHTRGKGGEGNTFSSEVPLELSKLMWKCFLLVDPDLFVQDTFKKILFP